MRSLKRALRQAHAEWRISGRRREIESALQRHFQLPQIPRFERRGSRGRDSIYAVAAGGEMLGMLRLINPYNTKPLPSAGLPFRIEDAAARIRRELDAYERGGEAGLAPKPLWHAEDALLCNYLAGESLQAALLHAPQDAWKLLEKGARALHALHRLGLTHMDASLANMISADGNIFLIDFEYAPAEALQPAMQRAYDHLRLAESAWKYIPPGQRMEYHTWLLLLKDYAGDDLRQTDLSLLAPALERLLAAPGLGNEIRRLCQTNEKAGRTNPAGFS